MFFEASKQSINKKLQIKDKEEIEKEYEVLDFFYNLYHQDSYAHIKNHLQNLEQTLSLKSLIDRISKESFLNLEEINKILIIIENIIPIEKYLHHLPFFIPYEATRIASFFKDIVLPMRKFITPHGEIQYHNHPELKMYFQKVLDIESKIRSQLVNLSTNADLSLKMQFMGHDLVNERFVLAIKADAYSSNIGQIISRSETGMTLFVEPYSIKELCNERLQFQAKILEIINHLSILYSKLLFNYKKEVHYSYGIFIQLDSYLARTEYHHHFYFVRPQINTNNTIEIFGLFHPLIKDAVKNDILIPEDKLGLIISGPNTGGKTAFLKALTLCHVFMHFGLYVPAKEANIPLFDGIFYFGNDGQNLNLGLSSFSSEVKSYSDLFLEFTPNNLIIIDEIFSSTSSEEASALAISLFDEIKKVTSAKIIISTHHQMLKINMHQNAYFLSAHVGFDIIHHKPNYKISIGIPGPSMALSIFKTVSQKNSNTENIYDKAVKILETKLVLYESLLQEVSQKKSELDKLIGLQLQINEQLSNQKKSHEGLLKIKFNEQVLENEKKLEKIIIEGQKLLQKVQNQEITKLKKFDHESFFLKRENMNNLEKKDVTHHVHLEIPNSLEIGKNYWSKNLQKNVLVKSINPKKHEVLVTNGKLTINLPIIDLYKDKTFQLKNEPLISEIKISNTNANLDYDCRGLRLDEFERIYDQALTSLMSLEVPFVQIIHGHGNGILKKWLRDTIKKNKELMMEIPEVSQDGSTVIKLKS